MTQRSHIFPPAEDTYCSLRHYSIEALELTNGLRCSPKKEDMHVRNTTLGRRNAFLPPPSPVPTLVGACNTSQKPSNHQVVAATLYAEQIACEER